MSNKATFIEKVKEFHPCLVFEIDSSLYFNLVKVDKDMNYDSARWIDKKLNKKTNDFLKQLKRDLHNEYIRLGCQPKYLTLTNISRKFAEENGIDINRFSTSIL